VSNVVGGQKSDREIGDENRFDKIALKSCNSNPHRVKMLNNLVHHITASVCAFFCNDDYYTFYFPYDSL
jgi:hypothetical protein